MITVDRSSPTPRPMPSAHSERDIQRADSWIRRTGGLTYVSPAAFDLLVMRLAGRHRSLLQCSPAWVLAQAALAYAWFTPGLGTPGWPKAFAIRQLPAFAILTIGLFVCSRLVIRADLRIARSLPRRASRGTAVSIPMMLGRARTAFLAGGLAVGGALGATTFWLQPGRVAWAYLAAYVAVCYFVASGVRRAAIRTTIAVDPVYLAIDERLGSEEAFAASKLWLFLLVAVPVSASTSADLDLAHIAATLVIFGLSFWATLRRPWPTAATPPIGLVAPPQLGGAR
jgi:hypothetical protein